MKNKKSRERRVLLGALGVAGVMIAGSTFAWFTSKDEVTNRLSASAEYSVAVAENFQPPENWVPGQEINKDASAVNTGNVDAFVRMWLDGSMKLLQKQTTANNSAKWESDSFDNALSGATNVTDTSLKDMGLTKLASDGVTYFKTLDRTQTINPNASSSGDQYGYAAQMSGPYSEVQAMQSGILAYAPANAQYSYVLKEDTSLPIYVKKGADAEAVSAATAVLETVTVPAGTLVMVVPDTTAKADANVSKITGGTLSVTKETGVTITSTSGATNSPAYTNVVYVPNSTTATTTLTNVEFESFTPMTNGLYLFLRNESDAKLNSSSNVEFSGYYMTGYDSGAAAGAKYDNAVFYALNTNGTASDYTVKGALPAQTGATPADVETGAGTGTYTNPIAVTITDGNITNVVPSEFLELYNAKYEEFDSSKLYWYYTAPDTTAGSEAPAMLHAVYHPGTVTTYMVFDKDKDIVIDISLANIKGATVSAGASIVTGAESWTPIKDDVAAAKNFQWVSGTDAFTLSGKPTDITFYYNNDVEAGDTSAKLVDKVKLNENVTNKAYLAFDFDLNVHLESVQVTFDENGNEKADAVSSSWAATQVSGNAVNRGATGSQTPSPASGEITEMAWS